MHRPPLYPSNACTGPLYTPPNCAQAHSIRLYPSTPKSNGERVPHLAALVERGVDEGEAEDAQVLAAGVLAAHQRDEELEHLERRRQPVGQPRLRDRAVALALGVLRVDARGGGGGVHGDAAGHRRLLRAREARLQGGLEGGHGGQPREEVPYHLVHRLPNLNSVRRKWELNSPVVERRNKGLMAVWSPTGGPFGDHFVLPHSEGFRGGAQGSLCREG
eukprot:1194472-Prorocentrum_minimum.AAC.7